MPQQPTPIQTNVFAVTVTVVTSCTGQPELQFNPDPVKLTKTPNALIVYSLVSPGYYFPVDGTALVIDCSDSSKVFPIAWIINASTLALGDYNSNAQSYKYTMTAINSQTGARITTDPTIDNNNE